MFCCHWTFNWRLIDVRLPQLYDLMVWEEDFSLFCVSLNAEVTRFTAAADLALFPLQSPFRPTELGSGVRNECRIDWISPSQRVSPNRRCVQITKYRRRERTPQLSLSLSLSLPQEKGTRVRMWRRFIHGASITYWMLWWTDARKGASPNILRMKTAPPPFHPPDSSIHFPLPNSAILMTWGPSTRLKWRR